MEFPKPYLKLNAFEKRAYKVVCEFLEEHKKLKDVDSFMICNLVKCLGLSKWAIDEMNKPGNGPIQTFKNKTRQVSPEWAVFRNAISDYESIAKHLGLSPKIRKDIAFILEGGESKKDVLSGLRKVV